MLGVAGSKWFRRLLVVVCVVAVLAIAATFILSHSVESTGSKQRIDTTTSDKLLLNRPPVVPYWYVVRHLVFPDVRSANYVLKRLGISIRIPKVDGFKVVFVDVALSKDGNRVISYEIVYVPEAYYEKFKNIAKKYANIDIAEFSRELMRTSSLAKLEDLEYRYWRLFYDSSWKCTYAPDYITRNRDRIPIISVEVDYYESINRYAPVGENCRVFTVDGARVEYCTDLRFYYCVDNKCSVTIMPNTARMLVMGYEKFGKDIWIEACLGTYNIDKTTLKQTLTQIIEQILE